ncbi:MAG: penicillin-binding transpeptidase domain-containing protein [Bacteroidales bacterium]|nr:penicillin-binding transpeptidase domain-containing protein [Bacteroidales bacterium]
MNTSFDNMTPNNSKGFFTKIFIIYSCVILFALIVFGRIIQLQNSEEGKMLLKEAKEAQIRVSTVEATRGKILDCNNKVLAINIPWYNVYMDVANSNIADSTFNQNVKALSQSLSLLFNNKSADQYEKMLREKRRQGSHYTLLKKNVNHSQLEKIRSFPILEKGQFKGGLIVERFEKRLMPYGNIARRTIGYQRDSLFVGLEGGFDDDLRGTDGNILEQQKAPGFWIPLESENNIEPQNGKDVVTTIDIVIQDVAHNSLLQILQKYKAEEGCVVLMEVATGNIISLVNLQRNADSSYSERLNIAIGSAIEPGSTFKTPSLMVALEDGKIKPTDIYKITRFATYANRSVEDSHYDGDRDLTVQQIFEESSNVGTTKIIWENYNESPQQFIDGLYKMSLNQPLQIPIAGAAAPYIKNTTDKTWSKVSLPWISFGYELLITPLQIATFYNAIANNGCMVNPRFVTAIRDGETVVKEFPIEVINPKICSEHTLKDIQMMLRGVVENGTGRNGFKNAPYTAAGKTGTSQIAEGGSYKGGKIKYNASFAGYFPAENPRYSCFVLIRKTEKRQYAATVAVPVFRDIADKVCAKHTDLIDHSIEIIDTTQEKIIFTPFAYSGRVNDLINVYQNLNIKVENAAHTEWVTSTVVSDKVIRLDNCDLQQGIIPNVINMTATDAVYLLEKCGYKVVIQGFGKVIKQSVNAGTSAKAGTTIYLLLG